MSPWPEQAEYSASVPEHCAGGTSVARVVAIDADASPTPARLRYSIVAGNPDGLFSIDEYTGIVLRCRDLICHLIFAKNKCI